MILKISDRLDLELLKEQDILPTVVLESVTEKVTILEDAYNSRFLRSSNEFGVIYLIFSDPIATEKYIDEILRFYNLYDNKELYEYSEIIGTDDQNVRYKETLYLLGNDSSVVFVYAA